MRIWSIYAGHSGAYSAGGRLWEPVARAYRPQTLASVHVSRCVPAAHLIHGQAGCVPVCRSLPSLAACMVKGY